MRQILLLSLLLGSLSGPTAWGMAEPKLQMAQSTPHQMHQPADAHEHHLPQDTPPAGTPSDPPPPAHTDDHDGHTMAPITLEKEKLTPAELIQLNMRRDGSGTGWQPMDNPMLMLMGQAGPWTTMLHWSAFLDYDSQGGPRGDDGIYSQNWAMASAARPVGDRGVFQARAMLSLDPLTVGERGYPALFQTGETYQGEPLIDRQHPHDLFMELSAQYYHRLSDHTWLRLYAAPVGEPALGPVAFPHRYSALLNPESISSHHMQDATHIAFGVLTAGIIHNRWQFEGSLFNGQEPDENRYDFDFGGLTSYSGRVSYLPNPNWAFQVSYGSLDDPEALEPGDVDRLTASLQHIKTWTDGWWASVLSFGHNYRNGPNENGIVLESTLNFKDSNYLYARLENVSKHGLLAHAGDDHAEAHEDESFNITAFTLGIARDLFRIRRIPITLGAQLTAYAKSDRLDQAYGDFPLSLHVYLHTNAPRMIHR